MKKSERGRGEVTQISWMDWMGKLLQGGCLATIVVILVLLASAAAISWGVIEQSMMDTIVLAACVVATLLGGLFAIGSQGARAIPMGLGVGVMLFLLCMTGGFVVYGNQNIGSGGVGILCACLCGGAMAGILRKKRKKKSKR